MHTANAAGREDADARAMCNPHRGRYGRCSIPAARDGNSKIARAKFPDVIGVRDVFDLIFV